MTLTSCHFLYRSWIKAAQRGHVTTVSSGPSFLVVVGGARAGCFLLRKSLEAAAAAADFLLLELLKLRDWWSEKADEPATGRDSVLLLSWNRKYAHSSVLICPLVKLHHHQQ